MMLILSLFPGLGLLDLAFEEAGFCVVRGPDAIWGGEIKRFHPPPGVFAGVIGGPPCQCFSSLVHMVRLNAAREPERYVVAENLIPEYERCVMEAQPQWFFMENVPAAPLPCVAGYRVHAQRFNNRWCGGVQNRERLLCFGTRDGRKLHIAGEALQPAEYSSAVLASGPRSQAVKLLKGGKERNLLNKMGPTRRSVEEALRLQGLPETFFGKRSPFTIEGKQMMVGNAVALPMGRAIAEAIRCLMEKAHA